MPTIHKERVRKKLQVIIVEQVRPGRRGEAHRRGVASETRKLKQLLKAITPKNQHPPEDFGRPQGKEVW